MISWTVAEQLRWVATRHASRPAIVDGAGALSFAQLYRRVNALAGHLAPLAGRRVGLYLANRSEWAETFFACQLAGVSVVPINDRYQVREVEHIVADADLALVVSDGAAHRYEVMAELRGRVDTLIVGPDYERALRLAPAAVPRCHAESAVLYTSGTTANPKGVRLTQANLMQGAFLGPAILLATTAADIVLIATPLGHRVGQVRLLSAVLTGACTVLISDAHPATLIDAIEKYHVSVTGVVPTIARDMCDSGEAIATSLASLRVLSVTGEPMSAELRHRVATLLPDTELWTFFASTEVGLATALPPQEFTARPGSSGRAVPGVEVAVGDVDAGTPSAGGEGEIRIRSGAPGSYAVAAGYIGAAEPIPFVDENGWFRTGDVGSLRDGWLTVTGRIKDMILSGGFNIAAAEVEQVLAQHPGVREVAVTGEPDHRFGERVVAWIVAADPGAVPSDADLREFMGARVAAYKRPRALRFIDRLPRTATGKLAKWQLPAAEPGREQERTR